jgi:hypothetical protein
MSKNQSSQLSAISYWPMASGGWLKATDSDEPPRHQERQGEIQVGAD